MSEPPPTAANAPGDTRRLDPALPFRRIAIVLSGGGALGAYEVGVLGVLERVGMQPAIVAGVSVGAMNAIIWLAHGLRTHALDATWRKLRGANIGLHWVTLALRSAGALAVVVALLEAFLTLAGSREFSGAYWLWKKSSGRADLWSAQLDMVSWLVVAGLGLAVLLNARGIDAWLEQGTAVGESGRGRALLGRVALVAAGLHAIIWFMGWPWPHRFSASLVVVLVLSWFASGPSPTGEWLRRVAFGLLPETAGRGLWGGGARRRVIEQMVKDGDARRLMDPRTRLIVSALAVDSGRVCHFINWTPQDGKFLDRMHKEIGEVVSVRTPAEMVSAVIASSAIPGVFEPVRIDGRDFVDAGGFSNQPLHVALAADADAVLVVLLTPSSTPGPAPPPESMFDLAGRLLELANWRDLQTELRALPEGFTREGRPARVCVVEPSRPLPGSVLGFDPDQAAQLIALGEADAWLALERSGWLAR